MHPYARNDQTSPGTTPDNPFVMTSVRQCYLLLNDLRIKIPNLRGDELVTQMRVSFVRTGIDHVARTMHPVDHFILYIGNAETGKLMDFYMYAYGDTCMGQEHLPEGLFTIYWREIHADGSDVGEPHPDSLMGQFNRLPLRERILIRAKVAWINKFVALRIFLPLILFVLLIILASVYHNLWLAGAAFLCLLYDPKRR